MIDSHFAERGLVRHQLDSFNEFILNTIADVVNESRPVIIEPTPTLPPDHPNHCRWKHTFRFSNVKINPPMRKEATGQTSQIFPMHARLRNLTYCAQSFVEVHHKRQRRADQGKDEAGWTVIDEQTTQVMLAEI